MTRLSLDGNYLTHIESLWKQPKHLSAKARIQLLRENNYMEEDDWREKVNNLHELTEAYRNLALSDEPSDEDSDYY